MPWWDLDGEEQARALGWALARRGEGVLGITTMGMTATEYLRLHNGKKKVKAPDAEALAYLGGE